MIFRDPCLYLSSRLISNERNCFFLDYSNHVIDYCCENCWLRFVAGWRALEGVYSSVHPAVGLMMELWELLVAFFCLLLFFGFAAVKCLFCHGLRFEAISLYKQKNYRHRVGEPHRQIELVLFFYLVIIFALLTNSIAAGVLSLQLLFFFLGNHGAFNH